MNAGPHFRKIFLAAGRKAKRKAWGFTMQNKSLSQEYLAHEFRLSAREWKIFGPSLVELKTAEEALKARMRLSGALPRKTGSLPQSEGSSAPLRILKGLRTFRRGSEEAYPFRAALGKPERIWEKG